MTPLIFYTSLNSVLTGPFVVAYWIDLHESFTTFGPLGMWRLFLYAYWFRIELELSSLPSCSDWGMFSKLYSRLMACGDDDENLTSIEVSP